MGKMFGVNELCKLYHPQKKKHINKHSKQISGPLIVSLDEGGPNNNCDVQRVCVA